ncbi:MAG: energy-coupling factor transporter ATPase [Chloroflexota bacterium]|nr:energy-coupling factor transporter ATPase [Chloroflexota bacterium]
MLIRVENLVHTYSPGTPLERAALRGVSLEIGAGERVGILGPTGSGKSTLVQHLAGLLKPTAGRVLLDGVAAHARATEARARRRRVGLAFQYPEAQIFELTVFREVAFGPRNLGLEEAEIAARVRWALEMVGLAQTAMEERSPFTLSGGEMRRVALASILSLQPEALILDEPTAGLDPQGRRELLARIQAWQTCPGQNQRQDSAQNPCGVFHFERNSEDGVLGFSKKLSLDSLTLIIVSHNLDELARVVERVVVLKEGEVVADGPARRVLSDGPLLRAAGLDAPQPVALLQALREAGWPVRTDRLLPEEAAAEIVQAHRLLEGGA